MAKKIIIIVIILILIALVLLFLSSQRSSPVTNNQLPVTNKQITNQPGVNQPIAQPRELTPEEKLTLQKNELMLKARNFVERYGSYSTDAQFANLIELKNEMSDRLWRETEDYILANEKKETKEFYGVTTKVLNVKEEKYSTNEATYLISTQRQEIKGINQRTFYQEAELMLIKENEEWRTSQIIWK